MKRVYILTPEFGPSGWPFKEERQQRPVARRCWIRDRKNGSVTCLFEQYFGQWMAFYAG